MLRRLVPPVSFAALVLLVLCLLALALPARAECLGQNLLDTMAAPDRDRLLARSHAVPFASGNFWRATKEGQEITLIGTYHLQDPRHAATMERLAPALDSANSVLVEAGPEEMAALKSRLARDPSLMVITEGPTLPETLAPEVWGQLSAALRARGVPPFMAAKMRPWYLSMILSVPPCALSAMGEGRGLDAMVTEAAAARGLPVRALEPYDTLFGLFDALPEADQLSMVIATLGLDDQAEDMSVTMADAYFAEEARLIWDLSRDLTEALPGSSPERVAHEFAIMEEALMLRRNRAWIPVLTAAAADGPVLAAFGALHLSGDQGVLALLQAEGFALERLEFR